MEKSNNSGSFGGGFLGILTLIFVIAKIAGLIDWSWWWVFSPIWIGVPAVFVIVIIIVIIAAVIGRK